MNTKKRDRILLRSRFGNTLCETRDLHLLVQPQSLFGEHGELLIGDRIEVNAGKVVADVDGALSYALLIRDYPPANQFTSALWRVEITSES